MKFALDQARTRGKSFLRMDCSAKHPRLREFYESHGFEFVDRRQAGKWFVDRLQKKT
jgi:hypothetical protein